MAEAAPFTWGSGGERQSPEAIKRRRALANAMLKGGVDYSPVQHWTQGLSRVAQALVGGYESGQLDKAESANTAADAKIAAGLIGSLGGAAPATIASAVPSTPVAAPATPAALLPRFVQAEAQYGLPPNYLAQTANIESRFNPNAKNPNSSASGLFQFTKGTAKDYGLANPFDADASIDAAARLAADNARTLTRTLGRAPTAGELYLAHQQGGGGAAKLLANPDARAVDVVGADAVRLNGGSMNMTAGEFAKRWTSKLAANEADIPAAGAVPVAMETGADGFVIPGVESHPTPTVVDPLQNPVDQGVSLPPQEALQNAVQGASPAPPMDGKTFNAIQAGGMEPVFQSEGVSQPWMGTALPPATPQVARAPMPPPRPADLAADLPAPGAVPAIGQMPPPVAAPVPPDLSNTNDAGARAFAVAEGEARNAQTPGAGVGSPFAGVAQALMGSQGGQAGAPAAIPAAQPSPAVAQVAQAMATQPNEALAQALMSSNLAIQQIAGAIMQQRLEAQKPRAPVAVSKDQRLVDPNTGRIILERDRNANDVKRSLTPVYGTDAQGNTVLLQPGDDGSAVQTKLPAGVKISAGVDKIDAGTEWILTDKRTGQVVGRQAKDIAGAEGQKIEGKATAEAKLDMPGAIAKAEQSLATIDAIRNHPGRNQFGATGWGSQLPILGDGTPGTKGRDFVGLVEQMKGKAFLEAFGELKGGGAISEGEGSKATAAIARLDRAQSKEGFDAALKDIEDVVRAGIERAKRKAGGAPGSAPTSTPAQLPASASAPPAGVDATAWKHMTPEERALWK